VVLTGTRSGLAATCALHVVKSLNMQSNSDSVKQLFDYNMKLADYFCEKLESIFKKEEIKRSNLTVVYPRGTISEEII
jgi:hypothetical protein